MPRMTSQITAPPQLFTRSDLVILGGAAVAVAAIDTPATGIASD